MSISTAAILLGVTRTGRAEDAKTFPKRPKVLLLGDSIRMSYQPIVVKKLETRAEVVGPGENCQYSQYTLCSLDRWIKQFGKPDIVHWNNGLHDVGHNFNRKPAQVPLETYVANLELIIERLKALTSRIVWASSTPVQPDEQAKVTSWTFRNDEIVRYNQAAVALMRKQAVPVNDLHAVVCAHRREYFSADQVHLNAAGREACADAIVKAVGGFL